MPKTYLPIIGLILIPSGLAALGGGIKASRKLPIGKAMVFDVAIIYLGITLAVAGWNLGVINAWPAPIAMLVATAATQLVYVDLCTWLVDQTRLPGQLGFFVGYAVIWLLIEVACELGLILLIPIRKRFIIGKGNRVAGAGVGLAKAAVVVVFATAATVSSVWLPAPPPDVLALYFNEASQESILMRQCKSIASKMPNDLADKVISSNRPGYRVTFQKYDPMPVDSKRKREWASLFQALRDLEYEYSQL